MPIKEVAYKSVLTEDIGSFLKKKKEEQRELTGVGDGDVQFLSVLDFIEKFKLLPYGLYPVQKFIVKLYYNIHLDDRNKTIQVKNMFGDKILYNFTEKEYLSYIYDKGSCNIKEQDGKERRELILTLGRRSGKCSDLSTEVKTTTGDLSLSDIMKEYSIDPEIGWHPCDIEVIQANWTVKKANGFYYGGFQKVRTITTGLGFSQSSTPEHRIMVPTFLGYEWRYFRDLMVGNEVLVQNDGAWIVDVITDLVESETEVADLNIPGDHEYVANGFWNHNSSLSSIFASYELYKLLARGSPQAYYGLPHGSEIRILCVANDKEQAGIVYGDMQAHVESVDYFKNSIANTTQTFMKFRTESDKERFGPLGKASLSATFKSSIAKGLRGRGVMCAILDEIAFFQDTGFSSAEQVYKALMPALAQFSPKDPIDRHLAIGPTHGRMILISSPDAKEGFFYRSFQRAMANDLGSSDTLAIQAPTWEVNPTLDRSYYEKEYHKDPRTFMTEHGAQFSDRVRGWIEDAQDLEEIIVKDLKPKDRGSPREVHFAGIDVGLVNDGTSIALTRMNQGKVELVYHEIWYAKRRWKDVNPHLVSPIVPYANTLQDVSRLDMSEIANWFKALTTRFYIQKGIFDQWSGIVFEQELHKLGLKQFESRNFFATDSSLMYQTFKMFMYNKQLSIYDYPRNVNDDGSDGGRRSPLIQEILELQAYSGGKNIITVESPRSTGKHDDMSDALARSILLASEYIKENPGVLDLKSIASPLDQSQRIVSYHHYQRTMQRLHGGSSRVAPRLPRR